MHYVSTRDLQAHTQCGEGTGSTPRSKEGRDLTMQCLRD
jgi:hypothetical protein